MTTDTALVILWLMTNVVWALAWRVQCAARDREAAGRAEAERLHAPEGDTGAALCGRRGVPLAGGGAVTCGNCRRRLEAAERRQQPRDPKPIAGRMPADEAMRATGWKRRPGSAGGEEWIPNGR